MRWSWSGLVVLVMAVALSVAWVATAISSVNHEGPLGGEAAVLLNSIGGGMVAIVAGWVGRHTRPRDTPPLRSTDDS